MPGPKKKPIVSKIYKEHYTTKGQSVTGDGKSVIMNNGVRFKRVILPSVAERSKDEIQLEEAIEEIDAIRTKEEGSD